MAAFTSKELFLFMLMLSFCSGILMYFFRKALKVILAVAVIICLYAILFNWLPAKIEQINSGQTTTQEVVDSTINDFGNSGIAESIGETAGKNMNYINENKEDWISAFQNMIKKITFSYNQEVKK